GGPPRRGGGGAGGAGPPPPTAGIGQTSWGPTGFAIVGSARDAEGALATAREATRGMPHIECTIVTGRNRGATVRSAEARQHRRIDAA
ncbi:hypothetical protein PQR13_11335, partial [Paraburkholderia strydomiana]